MQPLLGGTSQRTEQKKRKEEVDMTGPKISLTGLGRANEDILKWREESTSYPGWRNGGNQEKARGKLRKKLSVQKNLVTGKHLLVRQETEALTKSAGEVRRTAQLHCKRKRGSGKGNRGRGESSG